MRAAAIGKKLIENDLEGYTPLMLAIISGEAKLAIFKELIQYNADVNIRTPYTQETVLHICARNGPHDIFDYLLCEVDQTLDADGQTPYCFYKRRLIDDNISFKERGKEAIVAKRYKAALLHYHSAMETNPQDKHKLYSNVALVWYKLKRYKQALVSAEKCIELDPNFAKGYLRKGKALIEMHRVEEALASFKQLQKKDPQFAGIGGLVKETEQRLNNAESV